MISLAALGWVAAIVGAFYSAPQFIQVLRRGTTAGLSLFGWQLGIASGLSWTAYGVISQQPNVALCNVVGFATAAGIVIAMMREHRLNMWRTWRGPLLLAVALIVIAMLFGGGAFGLAIMVPQSIGMVATVRAIIVEPDLRGVSPEFLCFASVIQVLWLMWALGSHDPAILIGCTSTLVMLLVGLGCYIARKLGWRSVAPTAIAAAVSDTELATVSAAALIPAPAVVPLVATDGINVMVGHP